jgi:hypothetical protein
MLRQTTWRRRPSRSVAGGGEFGRQFPLHLRGGRDTRLRYRLPTRDTANDPKVTLFGTIVALLKAVVSHPGQGEPQSFSLGFPDDLCEGEPCSSASSDE